MQRTLQWILIEYLAVFQIHTKICKIFHRKILHFFELFITLKTLKCPIELSLSVNLEDNEAKIAENSHHIVDCKGSNFKAIFEIELQVC